MSGSSPSRGRRHTIGKLVAAASCAFALSACGGGESYQVAALQASDGGDQKAAAELARKEVARFTGPDQCSSANNVNCGTLALAYGSLASYQILGRDRAGGEESFRDAKAALRLTAPENKASATAIVYRDVSEAYWKIGDKTRAIDVFKDGRSAGGDMYLYMSSAARAVEPPPATANPPAANPSAANSPERGPHPADPQPADSEPNLQRTVRYWGTGAAPQ
jgi:hypothetical protein